MGHACSFESGQSFLGSTTLSLLARRARALGFCLTQRPSREMIESVRKMGGSELVMRTRGQGVTRRAPGRHTLRVFADAGRAARQELAYVTGSTAVVRCGAGQGVREERVEPRESLGRKVDVPSELVSTGAHLPSLSAKLL